MVMWKIAHIEREREQLVAVVELLQNLILPPQQSPTQTIHVFTKIIVTSLILKLCIRN